MSKTKPLTPRQCDVMNALIQHGSAKRAADGLGLSLKTVEHHLQDIKRRTGIRHTLHAILAHDRRTRTAPLTERSDFVDPEPFY